MAFGPLTRTPHDVYSPTDSEGKPRRIFEAHAEVLASETLARIDEVAASMDEIAVSALQVRWTTEIVSVRATANVAIATALENGDTLNGVTLVTGMNVFLPYQTNPAESGIYTVVASGAASRATWADAPGELARIGILVQAGSVGAGERWVLALEEADIMIGSTPLVFSPYGIEPSYADEVETARGGEASLNDRLDGIQSSTDAATTAIGSLEGVTADLYKSSAISPREEVAYPGAFVDEDDDPQNVIAGVDRKTGEWVTHRQAVESAWTDPRNAPRFKHVISAENGEVAIGVRHDGKVEFALSDEQKEELGASVVWPDALGLSDLVDVGPAQRLADGGYIFRAVQQGGALTARIVPGDTPSGFVSTNGAVDFDLFVGQSKAGPDDDMTTDVTDALAPHTALCFAGKAHQMGSSLLSGASLTTFEALKDGAGGNYPATLARWAQDRFAAEAGVKRAGGVSFTSWYGGQPLTEFIGGSNVWLNALTAADKAQDVMTAKYGRDLVCPIIVFDHGESGRNDDEDDAVKYSRSGYADDFAAYAAAFRTAVQAELAQSALPDMLFVQICQSAWYADEVNGLNNIKLAQLDAHEVGTAGLILAMPDYQHPIYSGGEGIHRDFAGTSMFGETVGYIRMQRKRGQFNGALRPLTLVRDGADIDIAFDLPGEPLAFDADWIDAAGIGTTKGFRVFRTSDDAELTISSVAITGRDTVRITLSTDPAEEVRVDYAINTHAATGSGAWSLGRGLLMSLTLQRSYYHSLGYAVPSHIRHYCVAFSKETSA